MTIMPRQALNIADCSFKIVSAMVRSLNISLIRDTNIHIRYSRPECTRRETHEKNKH